MRKPGKIDCNVFVSPTQQIHILVQVHEAMWSEEHLAQAARKEPAFPMLIQTAVIMPLDSQQKMDAQKGRAG